MTFEEYYQQRNEGVFDGVRDFHNLNTQMNQQFRSDVVGTFKNVVKQLVQTAGHAPSAADQIINSVLSGLGLEDPLSSDFPR